ncbi:MAG: amidase [Acidimicrobiales bacterium]|nr:amidase [Acidimicrobiales bacterium]
MDINDHELSKLDSVDLATMIRDGEISPTEAVQASIDRIEALDGQLNAVVTRRFERALQDAAAEIPDGPFRGVPFLLKDLRTSSANEPMHLGNKALKEMNYISPIESDLARRYREAGFIVIGRTNTPEFGLVGTTEPESYGPSRNPWNTEYGTGGSSGGAAAAVASGMVPSANASDGGGSIRIPAAMCGLVGLKPSRGRIPMGPIQDEWGLSIQHVVSHSVRDSAAILDATAIPTLGDGVVAPTTGQPYKSLIGSDPGKLRIGIWVESPREELEMHPECRESAYATAQLLEQLGHDVSESHPAALDDQTIGSRFSAVWMAGANLTLRSLEQLLGREITKDDVELATWMMAEYGARTTGLEILQAQAAMASMRRSTAQWWEEGWDILLTPTTLQPPPKIGELTSTPEDPMRNSTRSIPYAAFTSFFNVSGQPAISLPIHNTKDGLPIGVQLVAAYGREDLLFSVSAQLEEAVRWAERRAPIHA